MTGLMFLTAVVRCTSRFTNAGHLASRSSSKGYRSVLYPPMLLLGVEPAFVRYLELTSADPDCRLSDDIVLSNFLSALGVPRVLNGEKFRGVIQDYAQDFGATSRQSGGHAQRYPRVIQALRAARLLSLASGANGPCTS